MLNTIDTVRTLELTTNTAVNGDLIVVEGVTDVPFSIERVFWVQASTGSTRGEHAHIECSQFLICSTGVVEVNCDDGVRQKVVTLDRPNIGLLVPPGIWASQKYLTQDAILTVMCNRHYETSDYIRIYDDFTAYKRNCVVASDEPIRLNLGCGGRPLSNYINVDMDTLQQIKERYPNQHYDDLVVVNYDIFNLPFPDNSVEEVRSDALIEHIPFIDEPRFFNELLRVLKPGGTVYLSTVDFEKTVRQWLEAKDDWKDFYRNDSEAIHSQHWFGTNSYLSNNRWGYLTATLYGSQNGDGQFHVNCYTEAKLRAICRRIGLVVDSVEHFQWKGDRDHMLGLTATKIHE